MNILCIDTTGGACSAALMSDDRIVCEQFIHNKLTHSVHLMTLIDNCMKLSGLTIKQMDAFGVTVGPGSFTGIMIVMCAIKGFCQLTDRPAIAIDTLDAIARGICCHNGIIVPIMDARRGQVYTAIYREGKKLTGDMAIDMGELLHRLDGEVLFAGDGVDVHKKYILENYPTCEFAPVNLRYQRSSSALLIANEKLKSGDVVSCENLLPNYLRESQAERIRSQKGNSEQ